MPEPRAVFRFYDKNYNLLWEGEEFPRVLVVDQFGTRASYHIEVNGARMDADLAKERIGG